MLTTGSIDHVNTDAKTLINIQMLPCFCASETEDIFDNSIPTQRN
ncbi:hypothetical protein Q7O_001379 [Pectobacterium carotovorum subsp. carotovorum PCCS1]|nr:hypothetical protein [Pectobacterium carotovorum subsp. carotovorum PCCS1]